jgi:DNA-binding MarR family transcriptional regulator
VCRIPAYFVKGAVALPTERQNERRPTLIILLRLTTQMMLEELVARLAAAGYADIRPADSRLFENIDPSGTRLTELATRARMTHQAMGELVASLEERAYLERASDPTDRRARLVRLTHKGRRVQRQALAEIAEMEVTWFGEQAARVQHLLSAALRKGGQRTDPVRVRRATSFD